MFFVKVDSELNVHSRPFHWSRDFACCYLGRSHSAAKRVRILLAMETFKSLHTQDKGERLKRQKACSATFLRISMCERVPSTTCSLFLPDYAVTTVIELCHHVCNDARGRLVRGWNISRLKAFPGLQERGLLIARKAP